MKMIYKVFLVFTIFSNSILLGNSITSNERYVITILHREQIALELKSTKGWLRVFKSRIKLNNYEIFVTEKERKQIIMYLKYLYTIENNKYKKEI